MEDFEALEALAALSHPTRLNVFRVLVAAGDEGLAAGAIARRLGVRPSTLSPHLGILVRAGLAGSVREGRTIRYTSGLGGMHGLIAFLMSDCCGGRPEICVPLAATAKARNTRTDTVRH